MTTQTEALKLALEALEYYDKPRGEYKAKTARELDMGAITAIKEALAQEQEPVAQWLEDAFREGWASCRDAEFVGEDEEDWQFGNSTANSRMIDLQQSTPPQRTWVWLTDEEIWKDDAIMSANSGYGATFDTLRDMVRAVEAKLKEKNT